MLRQHMMSFAHTKFELRQCAEALKRLDTFRHLKSKARGGSLGKKVVRGFTVPPVEEIGRQAYKSDVQYHRGHILH